MRIKAAIITILCSEIPKSSANAMVQRVNWQPVPDEQVKTVRVEGVRAPILFHRFIKKSLKNGL